MSRKMNISSLDTIGGRIQRRRMAQGFTQAQLGELVNVTRQKIGDWEQNKSLPDVQSIYFLSKVLDCDGAYLLGEIESKRIGAEMISKYTGISAAAADSIIDFKYECSYSLLEKLILSENFKKCLGCLGNVEYFLDPPDPEEMKISRDTFLQLYEKEKGTVPDKAKKLYDVISIINDEQYDDIVSSLVEYSNHDFVVDREQKAEYELQQAMVEFRRAIDKVMDSFKAVNGKETGGSDGNGESRE